MKIGSSSPLPIQTWYRNSFYWYIAEHCAAWVVLTATGKIHLFITSNWQPIYLQLLLMYSVPVSGPYVTHLIASNWHDHPQAAWQFKLVRTLIGRLVGAADDTYRKTAFARCNGIAAVSKQTYSAQAETRSWKRTRTVVNLSHGELSPICKSPQLYYYLEGNRL